MRCLFFFFIYLMFENIKGFFKKVFFLNFYLFNLPSYYLFKYLNDNNESK